MAPDRAVARASGPAALDCEMATCFLFVWGWGLNKPWQKKKGLVAFADA
jgi:hypothetical protein